MPSRRQALFLLGAAALLPRRAFAGELAAGTATAQKAATVYAVKVLGDDGSTIRVQVSQGSSKRELVLETDDTKLAAVAAAVRGGSTLSVSTRASAGTVRWTGSRSGDGLSLAEVDGNGTARSAGLTDGEIAAIVLASALAVAAGRARLSAGGAEVELTWQ